MRQVSDHEGIVAPAGRQCTYDGRVHIGTEPRELRSHRWGERCGENGRRLRRPHLATVEHPRHLHPVTLQQVCQALDVLAAG